MEVIKVRGLEIGFRRKGSGPPLLLLHGAFSDSRSWRPQIEGLSDEFTVVAWDAPGCGRSPDPPEEFRLSDYADYLAAFVHEIGLERPHVLGLSFGSGLALELYSRYPDIPRTLVLASAYAGWAGSLPPEEVQKRVRDSLIQLESPPEEVVKEWLPSLFASSVPDEVIEETAAIMAEFHPLGMKTMLRAFAEADLRDVLPLVEIPSLLIYGECDRRAPLHIARELQAGIPNSTLVIIPGVGHESSTEAPEIFNAEVRRFLGSNAD